MRVEPLMAAATVAAGDHARLLRPLLAGGFGDDQAALVFAFQLISL